MKSLRCALGFHRRTSDGESVTGFVWPYVCVRCGGRWSQIRLGDHTGWMRDWS